MTRKNRYQERAQRWDNKGLIALLGKQKNKTDTKHSVATSVLGWNPNNQRLELICSKKNRYQSTGKKKFTCRIFMYWYLDLKRRGWVPCCRWIGLNSKISPTLANTPKCKNSVLFLKNLLSFSDIYISPPLFLFSGTQSFLQVKLYRDQCYIINISCDNGLRVE